MSYSLAEVSLPNNLQLSEPGVQTPYLDVLLTLPFFILFGKVHAYDIYFVVVMCVVLDEKWNNATKQQLVLDSDSVNMYWREYYNQNS